MMPSDARVRIELAIARSLAKAAGELVTVRARAASADDGFSSAIGRYGTAVEHACDATNDEEARVAAAEVIVAGTELVKHATDAAMLERERCAALCDRFAAEPCNGGKGCSECASGEIKTIGLLTTGNGHYIRKDRFDFAYVAWAIRRGDHVPWKERHPG